jgi:hypothetical protein
MDALGQGWNGGKGCNVVIKEVQDKFGHKVLLLEN